MHTFSSPGRLVSPLSSLRALGCGVVLAIGSALNAAQVQWEANVALPSLNSSIYFNPLTGEVSSTGGTHRFEILNVTGSGYDQTLIVGVPVDNRVVYDGGPDAKNLAYGSSVDSAGPFWGSANLATDIYSLLSVLSNFAAGETGYVGLAFVDNAQAYYGWASIVRQTDSTLVTLTGFGYNSVVGDASFVGAAPVPEPAGAGAVAAVAALLAVALRRHCTRSGDGLWATG